MIISAKFDETNQTMSDGIIQYDDKNKTYHMIKTNCEFCGDQEALKVKICPQCKINIGKEIK